MFPSTQYSILAGLQGPSEPLRREALDRFVEVYWRPIYKYMRLRWRRAPADCEDLTQAFLASLIERESVARFERSRGSFHTFLRTCIDNFVRDAAKAEASQRRGGGVRTVGMDFAGAEAECAAAPQQSSPEEIFLREWQRQIFSLAIADLAAWCRERDKQQVFAIFNEHDLAGAERPSYAELAARHALPVTQVTNYLSLARRELRRLALARIEGITGVAEEFRDETRLLFEP